MTIISGSRDTYGPSTGFLAAVYSCSLLSVYLVEILPSASNLLSTKRSDFTHLLREFITNFSLCAAFYSSHYLT